jgi:acyl carrier protein
MDLHAHLKQIIIDELNLGDITPKQIGDDDPLFGEFLGLDSIDAIELIFQVKKHFGVEIKDMKEGRPALRSVNTLAAFIKARQSE